MRRLIPIALLASGLVTYSAVQGTEEVVVTTTTTVAITTTAPTTTVPPPTTTVAPTTTEPTTTTTLPNGKCDEWFPLAVEVGWPVDRLEKLGKIMWAESRCLPDVAATGSYGLTQMQFNAHDEWLLSEFGVTEREELFDPTLNLLTALWLAEYAEQHYGCWAQPWYMSGDWC